MFDLKTIFFAALISISISNPIFAFSGYYQNINADIGLKLVATKNTDSIVEELKCSHGDILLVEKQAAVVSSDILGILVDDTNFTIYFKRSSWTKVREFSSRANGRKVTFVKNNKVISAPAIASIIDRAAVLPIPKDLDMEWFLKGFVSKAPPKGIDSEEIHIFF